jgi:hypothetical protein
MAVCLSGPINMTSGSITSSTSIKTEVLTATKSATVPTPIDDSHAATKAYVDEQVLSVTFLTGDSDPSDSLGVNGTVYFNTSDYKLYRKADDTYTLLSTLKPNLEVSTLEIGDDDCPYGGIAFTLEDVVYKVCNGAKGDTGADGTDGVDGVDGETPVIVELEVGDTNAPNGGISITLGGQTYYIKNGVDGTTSSDPPIINALSILEGGPGTELSILGANFIEGITVEVGGVLVDSEDITRTNAGKLVIILPSGVALGSVLITLINPNTLSVSNSDFTYTFGDASAVVFTTAIGTVTAAEERTITAKVVDGSGNTVTSYETDLVLSMDTNPTSAILSGTLTVAPVSGLSTFTFSITGYSRDDPMIMEVKSGSLTSDKTSSFFLTANGWETVAVDMPTTASAGVPFNMLIYPTDAYGNIYKGGTPNIFVTFSSTNTGSGNFAISGSPASGIYVRNGTGRPTGLDPPYDTQYAIGVSKSIIYATVPVTLSAAGTYTFAGYTSNGTIGVNDTVVDEFDPIEHTIVIT